MIADKRLNALGKCAATDRSRIALTKVHIKGNKAEATNGHVLAECKFGEFQDNEFPACPGADLNDNDVYLTPENIKRAFSACEKKKSGIPIIKNVRVSQENDIAYITGTDSNSPLTIQEKQESDIGYPETHRVWPKTQPDNNYFSIGLKPLQQLVELIKSADDCNARIVFEVRDEETVIVFYIPGSDNSGIHGLVMPMKMENGEKETLLKRE